MISRALSHIDRLLDRTIAGVDSAVGKIPRRWGESMLVVGFALLVVWLFMKNIYFGIGAVVALISGVFLLARPVYLIYLIFAFIPITWVNLLGRRFRVITFLTLAAFFYYLVQAVIHQRKPQKEPVFFAFGLYLVACALSLINTVSFAVSFDSTKYYILALMFSFALVLAVETKRTISVLMVIFLALGVFQSILSILQSAVSDTFYPASHFHVFGMAIVDLYSVGGIRRASGTFESGPRYAMFLLGPTALVLTAVWRNLYNKRLLWVSLLIIYILGLFVSFTRAAIVFGSGYFFLYNIIERDWRMFFKSLLWAAIFMVVVLALIMLVVPDNVTGAFVARFETEDDERYLDRFTFLYNAVMAFSEHPLLGLGVGTYPLHSWDLMQKYPVPWESLAWDINPLNMPEDVTTHNDYGRMLAETGFLSLLAYLLIFFYSFRNYWFVLRKTKDALYRTLATGFAMYLGVMIVYWFFHEYIMEEPYICVLPAIMSVVLKKLVIKETNEIEAGQKNTVSGELAEDNS